MIKTYVVALKVGEPGELYEAKTGDVWIEVRSAQASGADDPGTSMLMSFEIGGPDMKDGAARGLFCASGEFSCDTGKGDVWWACVPHKPSLAWGDIPVELHVLVRTVSTKP